VRTRYPSRGILGNGAETLIIGEGVATVLSASRATGHPGIAAFSDANLVAVAQAIRTLHPAANLIILADLVKVTGAPNPRAIEAARLVGGNLAVPDFGPERTPNAKDFNDMARTLGDEAVAVAIANSRVVSTDIEQSKVAASWKEPQPLKAKVEPEPYPIEALPVTVRAAVEEVAAFVKAPVVLIASSALAAVSIAVQAHVDVKRAERLQGPTSLFLLTIADSGERKSTCDGFFMQPIRIYQQRQAEAMKPVLARFEADMSGWTAERDGLLTAIKIASRKGQDCTPFKVDLAVVQNRKPQAPRVPRLLLGDETPENLGFRLMTEWPSAGIVSAEAATVLGAHGMSKDSVMRNLGLYNILWDGGEHSVGRRTSESYTIKGASLTTALQIQAAPLQSFLAKAGVLARGTGWFARFLIAWPQSTQGFRPFTEAPAHWPKLAAFHQRIEGILARDVAIDPDGALSPAVMSLSPDAKDAWTAFHDAIEKELASGGELYDVRDVASKTADNAARLAALFQVLEHGVGGIIGFDAFDDASRIAAWHLYESRRFFGELTLPPTLVDANRIDRWVIDHCMLEGTASVSKNHVRQSGPIRVTRELDAGLAELVARSRVRVNMVGRTETIEVNPALITVRQ
jgi:putative DNA primase/helicase